MSNSWWAAPMPAGWEAKWDAGQNRYFFIDHTTKKTSWVDPRSPQGSHQVQKAHPPPQQMTQSNQWVQRNGQWMQQPAASTSTRPQYTETSFVTGGTSENRQVANSVLTELKDEMNLTDEQLREFLEGEGKGTLTGLGVTFSKDLDSSSAASSDGFQTEYSGLISRLQSRYPSDLDSDELTAIVYQYEGQEWKIIKELKEKGYITHQEKAEQEREERDKIRKQEELLRDVRSRYPDISEDVLKMACASGNRDTATVILDEMKTEMEAEKRRLREAKAAAERRAEQERRDMEEALRIAKQQRKELEKQKMERRKMEEEQQKRLAEEENKKKREKRSQSPAKTLQSPPAQASASAKGKAPAKAVEGSPAHSSKTAPIPKPRNKVTKPKVEPSKWRGTGTAHGPDPLLPRGTNPTLRLLSTERVQAHGPTVHTSGSGGARGPGGVCGRNPSLAKGPSGLNKGPTHPIIKVPVMV